MLCPDAFLPSKHYKRVQRLSKIRPFISVIQQITKLSIDFSQGMVLATQVLHMAG